eukprot:1099662-Pyramimonas_sp.AAC.1
MCTNVQTRCRWDGVPFMMKAGKALDKRMAEIRVQFRPVPGQVTPPRPLPSISLSTRPNTAPA